MSESTLVRQLWYIQRLRHRRRWWKRSLFHQAPTMSGWAATGLGTPIAGLGKKAVGNARRTAECITFPTPMWNTMADTSSIAAAGGEPTVKYNKILNGWRPKAPAV